MATASEAQRLAQLNRFRRKTFQDKPAGEIESGSKAAIVASGVIILLVAAAADAADYFVIGAIPLLGDIIIDLPMWLMITGWVFLTGARRPPFVLFAGIIEFIPVVGDLAPTWFLMTAIIIFYNLLPQKVIATAEKIKSAKPI